MNPPVTLPDLSTALSLGFSHLDVELARLALDENNAPHALWWAWAVAWVSRAHAQGHGAVSLRHPEPLGLPEPELQLFEHWRQQAPLELHAPASAAALIVAEEVHLALRRTRDTEERVAQALQGRMRQPHPATETPMLEDARLAGWLKAWFPETPGATTDDQQAACRMALQAGVCVITGGPGTGKTHTAARLLALLQAARTPSEPLRIGLAAPTGKAASRLKDALELAWQAMPRLEFSDAFWHGAWNAIQTPRTLHSLVWDGLQDPVALAQGKIQLNLDVVLIDEASMMDLHLLDTLLMSVPRHAKLVFMGDRDQLASVEAGSVMADLCDGLAAHGALATLSQSRRFGGQIGQWAQAIRMGRFDERQWSASSCLLTSEQALELAMGPEGFGPFLDVLQAHHGQTWDDAMAAKALEQAARFRSLCAIRHGSFGVLGLNEAILNHPRTRGPGGSWGRHGRLLMVTRNDESTGLRNGDVGLVIAHRPMAGGGDEEQFVWMEGHAVRRVSCARLPPTEPAYAMTVHKAQGSEFDHVALVLPAHESATLTRELLYTGVTRARQKLTWVVPDDRGLRQAVGRPTRRISGLVRRLGAPG